jgi:hypothetical protein
LQPVRASTAQVERDFPDNAAARRSTKTIACVAG